MLRHFLSQGWSRSMKAFFATVLLGGLAAGLLAGSANAKTVHTKTYKPGLATQYTTDGDGIVIGPKAKVKMKAKAATHLQQRSINPQPEPPGRR